MLKLALGQHGERVGSVTDHADPLALHIMWHRDAGVRVDIDLRLREEPAREHGYSGQRNASCLGHAIHRERELGDIEFPVEQHPFVPLAGAAADGKAAKVNALGRHIVEEEGQRPVVEIERHVQFQLRHALAPVPGSVSKARYSKPGAPGTDLPTTRSRLARIWSEDRSPSVMGYLCQLLITSAA